jgi:MbtH protein
MAAGLIPHDPSVALGEARPRRILVMSDYVVVINNEDQYSIWRASRAVPDGWRKDGFRGSKEECLEHIDNVWTDMRPRSVRENSY